jgi:predicted ATPase/DNA-binding CsgD family transcriptional regulator
LSAREAEVASLVAAGKSTREIADSLFVTQRTVEAHVAAIYRKLDVHSRAELAVRLLRETGAASPEAPAPPPTNLPRSRRALVGRLSDCEHITNAIEAHDLVTLTGAGGIGKTRIALAIGGAWQERVRDGVWFIDLAPLGDSASVAAAVARALGIPSIPDTPHLDRIIAHLRRKETLLILDNCEHVIDGAALVVDTVLTGCSGVKILATSREPLRVADEVRYRVPSLSESEAAQLFAERVTDRIHHATFTREDRRLIAEICGRLDGIALAIELAAARIGLFSVAEIAANLDERFTIRYGGNRTARPRHQTMRALIDWSFDLLNPAEQRLFANLAIFAGGCTVEAAAAVCSPGLPVDSSIVDTLSSLIDKSLVVADFESGDSRYRLLESSRIYAREKLRERNEFEAAARNHARYYTSLAEACETVYERQSEPAWRLRSESELENWRAALHWSFGDNGDPELGQRLTCALSPVWRDFAHVEGRMWFKAAREHVRTPSTDVAARLAILQARMALGVHDYDTVLESAGKARALYRELDDPLGLAYAAFFAAATRVLSGAADAPIAAIADVLQTARAHGELRLIGHALESLAISRFTAGDLDSARDFFRQAFEVFRELGSDRLTGRLAFNLAELEFQAGNADAALEIALGVLPSARDLNDHFLGDALGNIAAYLVRVDRFGEAHRYALEAYELAYDRRSGKNAAALFALQHLAAIAALAHGKSATAARLLGYVDAHMARLGAVRHYTEQQEYDRILAHLDTVLEAAAITRLRETGASLNEESCISEARSALNSSTSDMSTRPGGTRR